MSERCYICGRTCEQVSEYLETMLRSSEGMSFDGIVYGPLQQCLNARKSLSFQTKKLDMRENRLEGLESEAASIERTGVPGGAEGERRLKLCRTQADSVRKEIAELKDDIARNQRIIDDFLHVSLSGYRTRTGFLVELCPVCLSLITEPTEPFSRNQ